MRSNRFIKPTVIVVFGVAILAACSTSEPTPWLTPSASLDAAFLANLTSRDVMTADPELSVNYVTAACEVMDKALDVDGISEAQAAMSTVESVQSDSTDPEIRATLRDTLTIGVGYYCPQYAVAIMKAA
jgi:type II secretory pathway component GspD/PulD (secretin)